jgi:thiol-disulfide isomerase/thioredoxin
MPSGSQRTSAVPSSQWGTRLLPLLLLVGSWQSAAAVPAELVGQHASDFALKSLADDNIRLSEHLGEVVILNFWATWCGPCRQEMPLLDEVYAKYRRAGLTLLSINIDQNEDGVSEMVETLKVSYPVLRDSRNEVARTYQLGTLPLTVLIDREGVIRYVSEGYKAGYEARYTEKLRELLNE